MILTIPATPPHSDATITLSKAITIGLAAFLVAPAVTAVGGFDAGTAVFFNINTF